MIQGANIHLRTVRESDLSELFTLLSDTSARGEHVPMRLLSEAAFVADFRQTGFWNDALGRLLICTPEGRMVGTIWYFQTAPYYDGVEIGYQLFDVESRGKGYTTEALMLFAEYLFGANKLNRLQLTVSVGNEASRRVAQKSGFTSEGLVRGAVFLHGRNVDIEMFSRLRSDAPPAGTDPASHG
ncbi:MAG TPA: GNAT family protein [Longimicrobium sp.]|jgi:RimJ/RimL family protein N-acetyltransferase|uniref:GNAT family N-acetyltransferase n=1 Tax=Longimicrobium sp. TaxID=2029185 RepID=UPI002EDA70CF